MPIARFQLPDGRVARFEVPEGTSPEAAQQMMELELPSVLKPPTPPKPEITLGGQTKEFFKGIPSGAVNLLESAATGASALLPEEMEKSARKTISETAAAAKKPFEAARGYEETIPRKFGEAFGSTAPFFALGPAGLAGRIGATGLGVGAGAGEARTRAEQEGATGEQRAGATGLGAVVGVTEMLPVFRFIDNLASPIKKGIMGTLTRAAATGGAEGVQEAAAQIAQNLIAKGVYKPDQAIIEQVGESAAYGTATGALVQVLTDMALGRRAGQGSSTPAGEVPQGDAEQQARRLAREQEQMGVKQGQEARKEAALTRAKGRGVQGELFSGLPKAEDQRDLFGNLISPLPPESAQEATANVPEGQMDLGLEGVRGYAELEAEKQQLLNLKKQEKDSKLPRKERTQGIDERVAEITAMQKDFVRLSDKTKKGTQGSLFTPQELTGLDTTKGVGVTPVEAPKQTKQRAGVAPAGEQLGLGIEATREYPDLIQERERLSLLPQTPEIKARLADLQQQTRDRDLFEVDRLYAAKAEAAEQEAKQAESAFVAPDEQPVTPEPTLVQKPEPLTPQTVPTTVTPDVLGALGIGRTAIIRKPDHGIMGKDIADPAQAAEVKSILEAYRQGRSAPIQEKIDAYLARPEFQAVAPAQEITKGETDARQAEPPTDRNGVQVLDQTGEGKPARRTLTVKRNGMVSPKPDVGQPVVGEAEQSTPVEEVQPQVEEVKPPAPPAEPKKPMGMFDQLVQPDTTEKGKGKKAAPVEEEEAPAVEEVKFDPWDPKNYKGLAQEIEKDTTRSPQEAAQDLVDAKAADRESKKSIKVKSKPIQEAVEEESIAEKDVRAEATTAAVKTLTGADKMVLAKHYKQPKFNKVAETSFVDDTIKAINEGIESVSKAIHKYVRKAMSGMLSVALVINPAFMGLPEAAIISSPATYTVEQAVKATIPAEAAKLMSPAAKTAYETILPAIKADLQARDKLFIINDKPSARTFLFTPDGQLLMQSKTLQGVGVGDLYKGNNDIVANRVTPAGLFNIEQRVGGKTAGEYDFGKVFGINDTEAFITIMHSVWTKEADAPQRLRALNNDSAADSRYSFGCINVPTATFKQMLEKHENQMNGAKMFIVPDNQARVKDFISGDIAKNTVREDKLLRQSVEPVTEKVTKTTSGAGNVQAGVDRTLYGKPEERFSRQEVMQGQTVQELTDEIAKGKGILANALRRMVQSGKVRLEEKHPSGEKIGGYFDGKTITLYADGIPSGDAMAVALHEVGAHLGLKNLLGVQQYNNIIKRIQAMATSKEASPARALAQRALSRIQQEDIVRGDEVIGDESVAYFIEELAKAQARGELQTVGPARALWNQIKAAIQATINRVFGTNLGVDAFTPEQIGLLANAAFTKESFTGTKEGTADLASRTGGFTDAFRKWFGNSKVVDKDGKPLMVYHGMANEMEGGEFRPSTYGTLGEGIYFTSNPEAASNFATGVRGDKTEAQTQGNVVPTYLRMEEPFDDNFFVGNKEWQDWAASIVRRNAPYESAMLDWGGPAEFAEAKKLLSKLEAGTATLRDILFVHGNAEAPWGREILKQVKAHGGFDGVILKDSAKGFDEYVVFKPNQIKSATGNTGAFDINNPDIRFSRAQGYTQQDYDEVNRIANSVGPAAAPAVGGLINNGLNAMNRATENSGVFTTLRQALVDKYATVESKVSNMFSKGVRDAFGNLNPMVLVRQAEDHAKVFMSFLSDGGIKFNKEGLVETFKQRGSAVQALREIDQFAKDAGISFEEAKTYMSSVLEGHRAYDIQENHNKPLEASALDLEKQGKNKEADAERNKKIRLHLSAADIATLEAKYQKTPAIQQVQETFNQTRMHAIDLLAQSGRISKEQANDWKENSAYVPFDRVMEDIGVNLLPRGKGLGVMTKTPEIKGSLDRRVKDVVDSYMGTLGWMVEESMRHNASTKLLDEMQLAGFAEKHPTINAAKNKNLVVRLYEDGKPVFYEVQNEYDLLAFKQAPEVNNMLVNGLAATSRFLRISVTAMPPFAVKQVVEDATRAAMYSGVERPLVVAMKTLYNMPRIFFGEVLGRKSPAAKRMEELGIVGDYDFNIYQPTNEIEKEIGAKSRGVAGRIFHTLEKFTKASDLAARMAVYEETMRESNGDEVLAQTRARELINFQRRGSSGSMRVAARVIPFFNAYAQGMDVLYRAASGIDSSSAVERTAARRLFMGRVAMMSALGFAYALAMSDDEGYKNATDDVRDGNWLLPNGYKLPSPKELGFIYKVIPERIVEYYRRSGTPEEQSALDALSGVVKAAYSAYSSPTTVPSYVRPILENMTNYSFFLQRELESASMQRLQPGQRFTSSTSELAKGIGEATNTSPIKIDNLFKGMFGMAGSTTLLATDAMLNPTRPDRPIYQMPFGSIFTYDTIGGRAKTEFYDLRERVSQADATYKEILKHDPEKAMKFYEENAPLIAIAPQVNKSLKELSELRRLRTAIERGTDDELGVDGKERRNMIDELRGYENESVGYVRELQKLVRDLE